ncbi:MAG: hypothetical protein KBT01_07345 [Clostridiales bacterium]|nr:hypothetical protein [Candidatus Blautia equi]
MEENFILPVGEGENQILYMIERALVLDGKCFFSILNLGTFDVMFGEFLGDFTDDPEENRARIYADFKNGCKHITYVDGYMEDMLYDAWDEGELF